MTLVRPADAADAAALAALDAASDDWPWPASRVGSACAGTQGQSVLLAALEVDPEVRPVAYVAFARVLDEGSIHRIVVRPDSRQKGLGGTLIDAALQQLRHQGARRILLEMRVGNVAAQALYGSRGFTVDARRKGYYPGLCGREDALLMSLSW